MSVYSVRETGEENTLVKTLQTEFDYYIVLVGDGCMCVEGAGNMTRLCI